MIRALACVFACALALPSPAIAAGSGGAPAPNLVFQLEKQNHGRPWLRVTTGSGRFDLHADGLDASGLHGFKAHRDAPLPRDPLAWPEIQRLDQVVTSGRRYAAIGAVVVGLLGAGLGAVGASSGDGGNYAMLGAAVGVAAGTWLGSSYGNRFQREVNWYTAPPAAPEPPPPTDTLSMAAALADSGRVDSTSAFVAADTTPEPPPPPEALAFAARIDANDLMRVSGDFHRFQGRAQIAGPEGLERLAVDRHAPKDWRPDQLPERLPWSAIEQVEMRHTNSGRVAVGTALLFGAAGALVATLYVAAWGGTEVGEAALVGAGCAGAVGLVIGAGIGSASHHWSVAYHRP